MRRRGAALFALVCVVAMPFELMVPDVHDADVAATLVVSMSDQGHPPANASDTPEERVPLPSHSGHVDHCTHAHVLGLGFADATLQASVADSRVPDAPSQTLLSVSRPPHRRPPIA